MKIFNIICKNLSTFKQLLGNIPRDNILYYFYKIGVEQNDWSAHGWEIDM